MKVILLLIFLIQKIFCYEVLYDKKFGTDTSCVDAPHTWVKLDGGNISSCPENCTKQYDSNTIVKFISDQNSSSGVQLSFTHTPTQPFSYVGVDIIFFYTSGSKITLRINDSATSTDISQTLKTTYDENYSIACPDIRSFYRGTATLSTNSLLSGNQIKINVEKESSSQVFGIRSIKVWTNCRQNCLTCSDTTNCSACLAGFKLHQMPTGEFVCEQTKGCTVENCYSCFIGNSSQICYRCAAGYNVNAQGTACALANNTVCPAYTYFDQAGYCSQYTYTCQYQDRTTNNWVTCANQEDPRFYKCDNSMAVRVYNVESYGVFQCGCGIPNCYSCSADLTTCATCKSGYTYNSSTQQCDSNCSSNQYYDGSSCVNCSVANCLSCSSAGTCDQCQTSYVYNNLSQQCVQLNTNCNQGYYYNSSSSSCQPCPDANCSICNSSGVCTTCKSNYTWNSTDNRCNQNCQSNQYFDSTNNICINCPSNCLNCNSSQCTQCNNGYSWNSSDQRCNKTCTSTQYFDSPNNNCIDCPLNCDTCNASQCTLCSNGYVWNSSNQKCEACNSNQYYDSTNKICVNCPSNCQTCNSSQCTLCSTGYSWSSGDQRCNKNCQSNQYFDSPNNNCVNCPLNCDTCNASQCTLCSNGYVWSSSNQKCEACNSNQYYDSTNKICVNCPSNCQTCNSSQCTLCSTGYSWSSGDQRCNKNCQSNQYFDSTNNNCINCPLNCLTCNSSQCTQCNNGYLWNSSDQRCNMSCQSNQYFDSTNNICHNCQLNCLSCNSSQCTQCSNGYQWSSSDSRCNMNCQSNQYFDSVNNNCINCPANCDTCNSSQCTQCSNGFVWSSNDSKCMTCNSNQFYDSTNKICVNCPVNCLACNSTSCTQCSTGYQWSQNDVRCNKICQSNQYLNQSANTCENCTQYCQSCNSSDCLQCQQGYSYDNNDKKCYAQCNSGQFLDKINNVCISCINNCINCTSQQSCDQCKIGYTYDQSQISCLSNCQQSQYFDQSQNQCESCIQNCNQCSDGISCDQCSNNYSYSSHNKVCYQNCQSNQYYDEQLNKCIDCGSNCLSCDKNQCTQCEQYFFTSQTDNQNCFPCQVNNCKTCSSLNICSECQTDYNLSSDKSQCSQGCKVSFCSQCASQSNTVCSKCLDGYELVSSQGICQPVTIIQKSQTEVNLGVKLGDDGYSIQVKFSNPVSYDSIDKSELLYLQITNVYNYTYSISDYQPKEIQLNIISQENIKNQQIKVGFKSKNFVVKNQIKPAEIEQNLSPSFVVIPQDQKAATKQATQLGDGATTLLATMIPIITMSNFYVLVNTIDITGFLYYLLYINIRNPGNVVEFYSIFQNFQYPFIPNLFQYFVSTDYAQTSFPKFMENQTDFYFLNSTGQAFTIHILVMSLYVIAKIMSKIKIKYVQDYFIRAVNNTWEYNGMLDLIWNEYIYSLVGVLLQFNCYEFSDSSAFLNYFIHSFFSIIILGLPFLINYKIYKQTNITENKIFQIKYASIIGGLNISSNQKESPQQQQLQNNIKEHPDAISLNNISNQHKKNGEQAKSELFQTSYQISSDSLVVDQKPTLVKKLRSYNKYYNCILYYRKMLFSLVLVFLTDYQYLQLAFIIILNLSIFFFMALAQPLQSKYENIKNCFGEIILVCIGVCLCLLVQDDESDDEMFRLKIGWVIIGFTSFILLWHTIQLTYETLKCLLLLVKSVVNLLFRRSQKVKPLANKAEQIDIEANHCEDKGQDQLKQQSENKQNSRKGSNLEETELILFQSHSHFPISDDMHKADSLQGTQKISADKNTIFTPSNNNSNDNLYNQNNNDNLLLKPSIQNISKAKRKSIFSNKNNKAYLNASSNQYSNRILNDNTNREDNFLIGDNQNLNNQQQSNAIIDNID